MEVLISLVSVFAGWSLAEISSWASFRRESQRRIAEMRTAAYAEWAAGMEAHLAAYAHQSTDPETRYNTPLSEKRLLLLEQDQELRELIVEVRDSIPPLESEDYQELRMLASAVPDWEWPPFRKKMDELLDRVRQRLR